MCGNLFIQKEIINTEEGYQITLKTDKLAKNVFLSIDEDGHFSDNYFDLLAGDSIKVQFCSPKDGALESFQIENFKDRIKVKSLVDTY